jgi:uncharacterized protein (DUF4415 family)
MKEKHIIRRPQGEARKGKTDWRRVAALSEKQVIAAAKSDPDAEPTDAEFWKNAQLVTPERKVRVTLRLDRDVLAWFKGQGRLYQNRMNAVLKEYMRAHRKAG